MLDHAAIRARIETALANECGSDARDVAFHMTDWLPELEGLLRVYDNPANANDEEVASALMAFLLHAPSHVAAASRLYAGAPVTDPFDVGPAAD